MNFQTSIRSLTGDAIVEELDFPRELAEMGYYLEKRKVCLFTDFSYFILDFSRISQIEYLFLE